MSTEQIVTHQQFIIARLADFCRYDDTTARRDEDPWIYMRDKLRELEEPLKLLKQAQLMIARDHFVEQLNQKKISEVDLIEFKAILNGYLSPGEFVDVVIHLDMKSLANPDRCAWVLTMMAVLKAFSLFDEEKKAEEVRFKSPKKRVMDMGFRLRLDIMEKILTRKAVSNKRKHTLLRRIRQRVDEFCSVLHLPTTPQDTFSPFMVQQVEAMVVALLRFMTKFR